MLNPKEEAKFKELKDKCRELKVPAPPEIFIGLQVHDKNGVLVFDDLQRGHSWTRNFYNYLFSITTDCAGDASGLFGAGYLSLKSTAAVVSSQNSYHPERSDYVNSGHGYYAAIGTTGMGIAVGTGSTAFSANDVALATQSTAISHMAMTETPTKNYTAGSKTWKGTLSRIFNNNTGSSITVAEVGLIYSCKDYSNTTRTCLFERSVLDPTVAVANGAQLTVTYEISMDFSAID